MNPYEPPQIDPEPDRREWPETRHAAALVELTVAIVCLVLAVVLAVAFGVGLSSLP